MDGTTLRKAMAGNVSQARYNALAPAVTVALKQANCTTAVRAAMFCAQIGHESMGLQYMEEIASGSAYEGRKDLGNTHKGDGVRFKGRGPIQITGRHNYTEVSKWAHSKGYVPTATYFVDNPTQLATDKYAFLGAVWYWTVARNMNSYADKKDLNGATRAINGALNGLSDRSARFTRCLGIGSDLIKGVAAAIVEAVGPTADGVALGDYKTSGTKIKFRTLYHNNNVKANSTCFCVTQAVAVAEARLKAKGVIVECLDFWQFGYGQAAQASADTHAGGGVIDTVQIDAVTLQVLREVGFSAAWYRGPGLSNGNFSTKHIHAVLNGCPHVSNGAKSQVTDVLNGGNGLGPSAHAKDNGPKVTPITWQAAFKKYVKEPKKASTSKPAVDKPATTTPNKDEGVLGMTDRISFRNTKPQKIAKANTLQWLRIEETADVTIVTGPSKMMANLQLTVTGMTEKDYLYVEVAAWDVTKGKAKRLSGDDMVRIQGHPSGAVATKIPFDALLGSKNKGTDYKALRIRVKCNKAGVIIKRADISGWEG